MVFSGGVIPPPSDLPAWSDEWQLFGDSGDEMRSIQVHGLDVSIYLYKSKKNNAFPAHWHLNTEMLMVISGLMTMDFEERASVVMRPGDSVFIPAGEMHSCVFHEDSILVLAFTPAFEHGDWSAEQ
jgi:quercetin dioxygenase-like cupin family protein